MLEDVRRVEGKKGRTWLLLLLLLQQQQQQHYRPFVSHNHGTRITRNNTRASSNVEEKIVLLEKKDRPAGENEKYRRK